VKLYPHQEKAVSELSNGCVLRGGVGSGKSLVAAAYYVKNETPKPVIVITTAKKRDSLDWESTFAKYGIGTELSVYGGRLTVDSWNNIHKYKETVDTFFIFDEQRLVGSGSWVKAFIAIAKRNRWILLSATPGDTWMDYVPVFVANGFYKNKTDFTRTHVVWRPYTKFPVVDRYVSEGRLRRHRDSIVVDMPYERHTVRHEQVISCDYDRERFKRVVKERWNIFTDEPIQQVAEFFSVLRRITNSDPSRIAEVRRAAERSPKLIIFYNFNYELEILREFCQEVGTPYAEWNGHKHEDIPKTDRWIYLVQYTAGAEGWNCIETDSILFYSLNYSYKLFEQSKGRIDRLNTPFSNLYYTVLSSNSPVDTAILKSLKAKTTFNEQKFMKTWSNAA